VKRYGGASCAAFGYAQALQAARDRKGLFEQLIETVHRT
jgi:hypothetical protein